MNKKRLPIILIILSVALAIARIVSTTNYNKEFWMFMVSSGLIILAMLLTLKGMHTSKNNDIEG